MAEKLCELNKKGKRGDVMNGQYIIGPSPSSSGQIQNNVPISSGQYRYAADGIFDVRDYSNCAFNVSSVDSSFGITVGTIDSSGTITLSSPTVSANIDYNINLVNVDILYISCYSASNRTNTYTFT